MMGDRISFSRDRLRRSSSNVLDPVRRGAKDEMEEKITELNKYLNDEEKERQKEKKDKSNYIPAVREAIKTINDSGYTIENLKQLIEALQRYLRTKQFKHKTIFKAFNSTVLSKHNLLRDEAHNRLNKRINISEGKERLKSIKKQFQEVHKEEIKHSEEMIKIKNAMDIINKCISFAQQKIAEEELSKSKGKAATSAGDSQQEIKATTKDNLCNKSVSTDKCSKDAEDDIKKGKHYREIINKLIEDVDNIIKKLDDIIKYDDQLKEEGHSIESSIMQLTKGIRQLKGELENDLKKMKGDYLRTAFDYSEFIQLSYNDSFWRFVDTNCKDSKNAKNTFIKIQEREREFWLEPILNISIAIVDIFSRTQIAQKKLQELSQSKGKTTPPTKSPQHEIKAPTPAESSQHEIKTTPPAVNPQHEIKTTPSSQSKWDYAFGLPKESKTSPSSRDRLDDLFGLPKESKTSPSSQSKWDYAFGLPKESKTSPSSRDRLDDTFGPSKESKTPTPSQSKWDDTFGPRTSAQQSLDPSQQRSSQEGQQINLSNDRRKVPSSTLERNTSAEASDSDDYKSPRKSDASDSDNESPRKSDASDSDNESPREDEHDNTSSWQDWAAYAADFLLKYGLGR